MMVGKLRNELNNARILTAYDVIETMPEARRNTEAGDKEVDEAVGAAQWRVLRDWLEEHDLEIVRRSSIVE